MTVRTTSIGPVVKGGAAFALVLLGGVGVLWYVSTTTSGTVDARLPATADHGPLTTGGRSIFEPPDVERSTKAPAAPDAPTSAPPASTGTDAAPVHDSAEPAERFRDISRILGRAGAVAGRVYTVTIPRDDFDLYTKEGFFPPEAGIASVFYFHPCDCGAMSVIGQFVVKDFETNDVIDALRAANIRVASVAPMLLEDEPKLMLIRFQGGGGHAKLAGALRAALAWTGDARNAPTTAPAANPRRQDPSHTQ